MSTQPTLTTERLVLRPFTEADAGDVKRLASAFAIADTTLNIPHPYEDGFAETWIGTHQAKFEAGELAAFALILCASNELTGAALLMLDKRWHRGELGYWIGEPYWGRGLATEASERVVEYGFEDLDLHRIHACHFRRNPASGRVLEKLGMSYEGTAREHVHRWDKYEDLLLYGLLRAEWEARRNGKGAGD